MHALIALKFVLLKMAYALLSGLMNWEPLVSKCKSLTIKVRALEPLITPPFLVEDGSLMKMKVTMNLLEEDFLVEDRSTLSVLYDLNRNYCLILKSLLRQFLKKNLMSLLVSLLS